jgi:hypothetical protein
VILNNPDAGSRHAMASDCLLRNKHGAAGMCCLVKPDMQATGSRNKMLTNAAPKRTAQWRGALLPVKPGMQQGHD